MHIIVNAINRYFRIGIGVLVVSFSVCSNADYICNLSQAKIVVREQSVSKAVEMLRDEISSRTGLALDIINAEAITDVPCIVLATATACTRQNRIVPASMTLPEKPEGYTLYVDAGEQGIVYLIGSDTRGVLFAAGDFIRKAHYKKGSLSIDAGLKINTAPKFPMRGHQLGYRDTPNSYDAWDVAAYEQYFRDLAIFGTKLF